MLKLMKCPYCNSSTKVTNSRSHNNDQAVWRRRECKSCNAIWTTDESYNLSSTHSVSDSRLKHLEPFQRDILFVSILDSLRHRKHPLKEASALTDTIIGKVLSQKQAMIRKDTIKQISYETLQAFNQTAAEVYIATNS